MSLPLLEPLLAPPLLCASAMRYIYVEVLLGLFLVCFFMFVCWSACFFVRCLVCFFVFVRLELEPATGYQAQGKGKGVCI
jgi:hypothetical protein